LTPAIDAPTTPRVGWRAVLTPGRLDWAERLLVVAVFGWLAARLLANYWDNNNLASLFLLPSEGLVVVFLLIRRRATEVSLRPGEWFLAAAATCTPLMVNPGDGAGWLPPLLGVGLLLMGMAVQVHAKLTLGRSFGWVPANRGLKLGGPYRFVRHPMYAGYLLSHVAFLLMNPTGWNLAVYVLAYGLQTPRILAEERLLSRDADYRAYRARVRFRLIPGVF
jgi:protein-S-isoprenylcysteine O-methyltransferase Ste14